MLLNKNNLWFIGVLTLLIKPSIQYGYSHYDNISPATSDTITIGKNLSKLYYIYYIRIYNICIYRYVCIEKSFSISYKEQQKIFL